jgi:hypothetical protein
MINSQLIDYKNLDENSINIDDKEVPKSKVKLFQRGEWVQMMEWGDVSHVGGGWLLIEIKYQGFELD